jgi:hypothetical protein
LLESHRSEQQNSADNAEDRVEVILSHSHDVHALDGGLVFSGIVDAGNWKTAIGQERITAHIIEDELLALISRGAGEQLVEDMECSLLGSLANSSRLLEQVSLDVGSRNVTGRIEVDSNEFALLVS